MRVTLITPPSCFLLDERVFVTLGILKVAASLECAGHTVNHIDLSGVSNYEDVALDFIGTFDRRMADSVRCHADFDLLVVGLTATTPQMPACSRIVKAIRQAYPGARIILGGPHVTLVHAAYRNERKKNRPGRAHRAFAVLQAMFDVLVTGDGEESILEAIKPDAPQLIDADDPKSKYYLRNLNLMPLPARHLIDMQSYNYTIDGERATSMIAQLGCPFNCGFCGGRSSPMLRRVRTRTTQNVIAEMRYLHEVYGVTGIMLYDDELNVNKNVVELMDAIHDLGEEIGVNWSLRGFVKAELFTEEQARAMRRAGFRWLLVGFESGSPRILDNINKKATREDNTRCLRTARDHGIKVKALMSLGHPGESEATVRDTMDWLLSEKPDDFDATVITTYPGTPYYDDAVETQAGIWTYTAKNGDRLHALDVDFNQTAEYYKGVPGEYSSFVFTDHLSSGNIVRLRDDLENKVRGELGIPFNQTTASKRYEASMGQLPGYVLRSSEIKVAGVA